MCVLWHLANLTTISVPCGGEVGPSDAEQVGRMQATVLNQLPGGTYWPWDLLEGPADTHH